jgi:prepilin-type processing-associated H-X9-DG protein
MGLTRFELLVILCVIALLFSIFLAFRIRAYEDANRMGCANNLRQIGQAILIYSNDEKGPYPRTIYAPGPTVTPTWGTGASTSNPFAAGGPAPNDVSAALFLLLRTQDIVSSRFICPSTGQTAWDFGGGTNTAKNWSNWNGAGGIAKHLSYSYANPYPDDGAQAASRYYKMSSGLQDDFAVAADKNPGPATGVAGAMSVNVNSPPRIMRQGNSRNHGRDGQNVLFGDGHVEFVTTAFCGVKRDNIYTRRAPNSPTVSSAVADSPFDTEDSVLLPCE